jgi:hypothetical protein
MSDEGQDERLARVTDWAVGYRRLMRGGLGNVIHAAGAFADRDEQPYITIDDIEWLIAARISDGTP